MTSRETNKNACVFFLKYPGVGRVKTRLASGIGDIHAFKLYECFVRDMLTKLVAFEKRCDVDLHIFLSSAKDIPAMRQWLEPGIRWPLHPQEGQELGCRMQHAFETVFRMGYATCLLTGSDIPDLPGGIFTEAFEQLSKLDSEAVIGPTVDGGYYLLGFRHNRFCPDVFNSTLVNWSTEMVFQQTMDIFYREGIQARTLPQWWDIDEADDLQLLMGRDAPDESYTMRYLEAHRDELF